MHDPFFRRYPMYVNVTYVPRPDWVRSARDLVSTQ